MSRHITFGVIHFRRFAAEVLPLSSHAAPRTAALVPVAVAAGAGGQS